MPKPTRTIEESVEALLEIWQRGDYSLTMVRLMALTAEKQRRVMPLLRERLGPDEAAVMDRYLGRTPRRTNPGVEEA